MIDAETLHRPEVIDRYIPEVEQRMLAAAGDCYRLSKSR